MLPSEHQERDEGKGGERDDRGSWIDGEEFCPQLLFEELSPNSLGLERIRMISSGSSTVLATMDTSSAETLDNERNTEGEFS